MSEIANDASSLVLSDMPARFDINIMTIYKKGKAFVLSLSISNSPTP